MNRPRYDQCYLAQQARQSTMPIDMIMMPFRNQHVNSCRDDSALGGRGVPVTGYNQVVDVESDLHGLNVTLGGCNSRGNQYIPSCQCAASSPCQCGKRNAHGARTCPAAPIYAPTLLRR